MLNYGFWMSLGSGSDTPPFLDHRLRDGPMDSGPSVSPSVRQLPTFLRIGSLFFSDFFSEVRGP